VLEVVPQADFYIHLYLLHNMVAQANKNNKQKYTTNDKIIDRMDEFFGG